jgi:hypothetical protein
MNRPSLAHALQSRRYAVTALALCLITAPALGQWSHLGAITAVDRPNDRVLDFHCGAAILRLSAMEEGIVRIRLAPDGVFEPGHPAKANKRFARGSKQRRMPMISSRRSFPD